jgi:hypothetical protein
VEDVLSAFSNWVSGPGGSAPGRPIGAGEDVQPWVLKEDAEKRVLAVARGGEKLVAIRDGPTITFGLDNFGVSGTIQDLRERIAGEKMMIVGPGDWLPNGRHDLRPVFGVVTPALKRVEFT